MTITRFRVAISYASAVPERFELVAQVAEHLAAAVGGPQHVLYDRFHEAEFSRPDLDEHLIPLYLDHSELMVVFLDEHYERSQWCGLEWRVVRALIKQRKQSTVMLVRFDATQPKALLGLAGFLDIDGRTAETIASLVLQRWEQETGGPRQSWPPASREPARTSTAVQAQPPPPKVAPTRLPPPACPIFGREEELARLDAAWASSGADQTNVVTLVAWGGVGKTALLFEWMNRLGREGWRGA
ncbi:MAG: TIR domain-containing protein, partial [Nannocystaceae bacterium]